VCAACRILFFVSRGEGIAPSMLMRSAVFGGGVMLDIVYVLLTFAFFALMLLYVRGCARLGETSGTCPEER
jgi:hypothetical protein